MLLLQLLCASLSVDRLVSLAAGLTLMRLLSLTASAQDAAVRVKRRKAFWATVVVMVDPMQRLQAQRGSSTNAKKRLYSSRRDNRQGSCLSPLCPLCKLWHTRQSGPNTKARSRLDRSSRQAEKGTNTFFWSFTLVANNCLHTLAIR